MSTYCLNCNEHTKDYSLLCTKCKDKQIICEGCGVAFLKFSDIANETLKSDHTVLVGSSILGLENFCKDCVFTCSECLKRYGYTSKIGELSDKIGQSFCLECLLEIKCEFDNCNSQNDLFKINGKYYCTTHRAYCDNCARWLPVDLFINNKYKCLHCQQNYNKANKYIKNTNPRRWTKILLSLGYTVIHDPGLKIVHSNEPSQALALGSFAIEYLTVTRNKNDISDNKYLKIKELKDNKYNERIKYILKNQEKLPDKLIKTIIGNLEISRLNNENLLTLFKIEEDKYIYLGALTSEQIKFLLSHKNVSEARKKDIISHIPDYTLSGIADFLFSREDIVDMLSNFDYKRIEIFRNIKNVDLIFKFVEKYNWSWFGGYKIDKQKYQNAILKHADPILILKCLEGRYEIFEDFSFWKKLFNKLNQKKFKNFVRDEELPVVWRCWKYFPTEILKLMTNSNLGAQVELELENREKASEIERGAKNTFEYIVRNLNEIEKGIKYFPGSKFSQTANIFQDEFLFNHIEDKNYLVRKHVAEYISPEYLIYLIEDPDKLVRAVVAKRIQPDLLPNMMHDKSPYVRSIVAQRIDISLLREFDEKHPKVKEVIRKRFKKAQNSSKELIKTAAWIRCRLCHEPMDKSNSSICSICMKIGSNVSAGRNSFDEIIPYVNKSYHYIHFTKNPSLQGLNPKSRFSTPLGIYGYPLDSEHMKKIDEGAIEYGGGSPYILVFKAKNPESVLHLGHYTKDDLENDVQKLISLFPDKLETIIKLFEESEERAIVKHPGSQLFYITLNL